MKWNRASFSIEVLLDTPITPERLEWLGKAIGRQLIVSSAHGIEFITMKVPTIDKVFTCDGCADNRITNVFPGCEGRLLIHTPSFTKKYDNGDSSLSPIVPKKEDKHFCEACTQEKRHL